MKQVLIKKAGALKTLLLYSQEFGSTQRHINLTDSNTVAKLGSGTIATGASTVTFSPVVPFTTTSTATIVCIATTSTATGYPVEAIGTAYHGTFDVSGSVFTSTDTLTGDGLTGIFAIVESDSISLLNVSDIEYEMNKQYFVLVNDVYDDRMEYYDDTLVASGVINFNRPRKKLHIWNTGGDDLTIYLVDPAFVNSSTTTGNLTYITLDASAEYEIDTTFINWQTAFIKCWITSSGTPSYRLIVY
jgi:hypothetical protein